MIVRICFKKYGAMKFIGHLDLMRYFQKAFRRAKYDMKYSQGYNPRMILSFASPLGVGITSDREYLEIGLNSSDRPEEMINRLNNVLTEGFIVNDFIILKKIDDGKIVPAMSLVTDADYLVSLKDGYNLADKIKSQGDLIEEFNKFINQEEIIIMKKTKKSEVEINIKPLIKFIAFDSNEYIKKLKNISCSTTVECNGFDKDSIANSYDNGILLYMQLSSGSVDNLKPELVMEAFLNYIDIEYNPYAFQIHRLDVYTRDSNSGKIKSLAYTNSGNEINDEK